MSQFPGNGDFYNHDEISPTDRRDSFELWVTSNSAYVPMTRGPSGDSMTTSYGSDQVQTPTSDYGAYNSPWTMPLDNYDYSWSPTSDFNPEIAVSPTNYNAPYMSEIEYTFGNGNGYNTGDQDAYWEYHGSIPSAEPNQQAYWRSRPDLEPIDPCPATGAAEDTA
ncbi:hypothetical protein O1611_g3032 [Lasiodiplodia mahajangana]|uniref:Uncharacterized protein n=1 Tax=Lasiodiplodia mahajangana TaxID=1108764 RepID=A0ACC2JSV8_9PEZI|nr:hypothetical protein O1611_g3032 [Lasiodiplodia mahajangana]